AVVGVIVAPLVVTAVEGRVLPAVVGLAGSAVGAALPVAHADKKEPLLRYTVAPARRVVPSTSGMTFARGASRV
ncbi:MAG: hypothetical protein ACXWQZ_20785, partial [Ktedonobacterales bacterium]